MLPVTLKQRPVRAGLAITRLKRSRKGVVACHAVSSRCGLSEFWKSFHVFGQREDKGIDFRVQRRFNSALSIALVALQASSRGSQVFTKSLPRTISSSRPGSASIAVLSFVRELPAVAPGSRNQSRYLAVARVGSTAVCRFGHQAPPTSMVPQERSFYEQHRRRAIFQCNRA